jgi:hypothetical protein
MSGKKLNRIDRSSLVIWSIIVSLLISEILLQLLTRRTHAIISNVDEHEMARRIDERIIYEPFSEWVWAGGQSGKRKEFFIKGHWNNLICHDARDYVFDPRKVNLLFLGDSFVEALQVSDSETFYNILSRNLKANSYNIMGCGRSGWSPTYALANLRGKHTPSDFVPIAPIPGLESLRPQYIFYLLFLGNDLRNESPRIFKEVAGSLSGCLKRDILNQVSTPIELINRLRDFYYLYIYTGRKDFRCISDEYWPYYAYYEEPVSRGFLALEASLLQLKNHAAQHNAKFIFGLVEPYPVPYGNDIFEREMRYNFPDGYGLPFDLQVPGDRLKKFAIENQIPFVNFSEVFSADQERKHYYKMDGHLSSRGHQVISDYLVTKLETLFPP